MIPTVLLILLVVLVVVVIAQAVRGGSLRAIVSDPLQLLLWVVVIAIAVYLVWLMRGGR